MTDDPERLELLEEPEVEHHDHADEHLEQQDELALRDQVGLAGLVNQLGDLEHRRVHRQVLQLGEDDQPEQQAERAHAETGHQQGAPVDAAEFDLRQIRKHEVHLAAARRRCSLRLGRRLHRQRRPRRREDRTDDDGEQDRGDQAPQDGRNGHAHLTSHKSSDYTRKSLTRSCSPLSRSRDGSAMPPVRKMRIPSSTVIAGNVARPRSQMTMSPRYRWLVGT